MKNTTNLLIFLFLSISAYFIICGIGIRYNQSESLPHAIYLSVPISSEPELGEIVTFKLPSSSATFAKIIAGLPGDTVKIQNRTVYINDCEKGKIIDSLEPIQECTIPKDFYFVIGAHKKSFDSRYETFGLIPKKSIKDRLCPIF